MSARGLVRMLRRQGISDERVLSAMGAVPRDEFVPEDQRRNAWDDRPLPIGEGQTISQPYVVAYMAQALRLPSGSGVLDVGTGCGYQAAVLAACGYHVHSVEIRQSLARRARDTLTRLGYAVDVVVRDGWHGLAEHSPFDGIAVAAAADQLPHALVAQLRAPGGRMVIPLGGFRQQLVLVEPGIPAPRMTGLLPVRFVPLIRGTGGFGPDPQGAQGFQGRTHPGEAQ